MDIEPIKAAPEGKTLEFKRDISSAVPILKTVCAFANTAGGTLLIGIEDRSGAVIGVDDPLDAEERLASIIADGITPRLLPDIEIVLWRDTHVVVVRVHPGPSRPYYLVAQGSERGAYVRLGSTDRTADPELFAELARSARGVGFDEGPDGGVGVDALDAVAIRRVFGRDRDIAPAALRTLKLTTVQSGAVVPTVGGMLLFGRDRLERYPDAWLQAGRFRGLTKSAVIDSADITAGLVDATDQAIAFVLRNTAVSYEIRGARRIEVPEYPPVAVREAVVNAVVYADYSQRGGPIRIASDSSS